MNTRIITLLFVASCGGDSYNDTQNCKDHTPPQSEISPNQCRYGAKLVVEDSVAVCRCPEKGPEAKGPSHRGMK